MDVTCSNCGAEVALDTPGSVNAALSPELKEKITSGTLFLWECPACGRKKLLNFPLVYNDRQRKYIIALSPTPVSSEGEIPGYTVRQVATPGELIEKIKIFDSELDDIAVEMCKFVTARELGKEVELKFFSVGGSDHVITLTYPENGEMQMLEIGFNVYEDCCGIISRNPVIRDKAKGLVRVDQAWLSQFFGG